MKSLLRAASLAAGLAVCTPVLAEDVMVTLALTCLPADPAAALFTQYGLVRVAAYEDGYGQARERWQTPDGSDWAEVGLVELQGGKGLWRCLVAAAVPIGEPS